ncbi:MAG TPA: glycosyltransferase family 2 protein [Patescibacteria group bacterium]
MKHPKVSLLLLNWNGFSYTKRCIKSLLNTNYPNYEIIVLDNGSRENEAGKISQIFEGKVKIIQNKTNAGYAAGMNIAFKHSSGDFIMVLNNDMEFNPNWLTPLVHTLTKNKDVALCQPKVKDMKNKKYFEYAAAAGGFIDIFGYPFARGRIFSNVEKDEKQYDSIIPVAWAGVFLARRKVIEKIGFFDEMYFTYAEDVDFCWRVYGSGYKIVFVPDSVVYHYGGGVIGKSPNKKMFYIHRNHLILVIKNWPTKILFAIIMPRILMDVLSFFYYALNGYPSYSWTIIKAYVSLICLLPHIMKQRASIKERVKMRAVHAMPILYGSLVWEYFIRKRKKFSLLYEHAVKDAYFTRFQNQDISYK